MNVTIFGSGYVGLVTGACLAEVGNQVLCVDIDERRVERLRDGDVPIFEPDLPELVRSGLEAGRLMFSTDLAGGVGHGDVLFVAVGTPSGPDGDADLRAVRSVAGTVGDALERDAVVVIKSTAPVGTVDLVRRIVADRLAVRAATVEFDVVANPEFLREGVAVADFMRPDRIVVGSDNPRSIERLRELYAPFNRSHDRMIVMGVRSAEFTKYAANVMLATRISLMNELANLGERLGVDIEEVRIGVGSDPRIGYAYLYPGCGYGGSCLPKDVRALLGTARRVGFDAELLRAVDAVNERQRRTLFDKVVDHFGDDLTGKVFAVWGLAFKPETDDMREAPSQAMLDALWGAGATVRAFDPQAMGEAARVFGPRPDLALCQSRDEALVGADALLVLTEWREFRSPDFDAIKGALRHPVVFDGRNLYDPRRLARAGFAHYGIGRGTEPVS
ncbi:MAG: UDP-glucose/GDP-mannose dehydrogenase family protein [Thermomicrobiales bacterium]|nr:UDP-glucose/GDP-mannose dehydrogenase family protein [Thermomicrobiales bacterium]